MSAAGARAAELPVQRALFGGSGADVSLALTAELGGLFVLSNRLQYGHAGTQLQLATEGGEDTEFFTQRLVAAVTLFQRHSVILTFQPLDLRTRQVAERDLRFVNVQFAAGTPIDYEYGFDFYRLGYQYAVIKTQRSELALGGDLQLRNARVNIASVDGKTIFTNDNLGPVPLLRAYGRTQLTETVFAAVELDGIYAPLAFVNGGTDGGVVGAVLDASLRIGADFSEALGAYLNLRYFGGGFRGDVDGVPSQFGTDLYSSNWLHTFTVSIGVTVR